MFKAHTEIKKIDTKNTLANYKKDRIFISFYFDIEVLMNFVS